MTDETIRSAPPAARAASRVTSFDVSRGIAITGMVAGHAVTALENTDLGVNAGYALANEIFHTVRMPLFFFLAGVFVVATMRKHGYGHWVLDKAQYLLYPWLVWSVLRGLIEVGFFQVGIGGSITIGEVVYGIVWDPRIWYLPALFVAFVVVGGAYRLTRGRWWWWPAGALAIVGLVLLTELPWWPPLLHVHPFTAYLLLGVVLSRLAIAAIALPRRLAALGALAAALLFSGAVLLFLPTGMLEDDRTIGFILCAIPGIALLLALGRLLDRTWAGVVLERLGRWSLVIYVAHAIPVSITRVLLMRAGVEDYTVLVVLCTIAGVAAPALLGWLVDRGILRFLITMPGYRKGPRVKAAAPAAPAAPADEAAAPNTRLP